MKNYIYKNVTLNNKIIKIFRIEKDKTLKQEYKNNNLKEL